MSMTDTFTVLRILTDDTVTDIPNAVGAISWEWVFTKGTEETVAMGTTVFPLPLEVSADAITNDQIKDMVIAIEYPTDEILAGFFEQLEYHLDVANRINELTEYFVDSAYTYME